MDQKDPRLLLATFATEYTFEGGLRIQFRNNQWKVTRYQLILNKEGEWEHDVDFPTDWAIRRTRFSTLQEAVDAIKQLAQTDQEFILPSLG